MKIAYFIGTLKKEDGVTRVLLALINEALKKGIESVIVTGWAEDSSISPVPVILVPSVIFPLYKDYRLPLPSIKGFSEQIDKFKPDVIHLHSPDTIAWQALKYSKKRNVPIVATYHSDFGRYLAYYHLGFLRKLVWALMSKLYKQMRFVTTPSAIITEELIGHGIPNVYTQPWGVDFANFGTNFRSDEFRNEILKGENKIVLLSVSRLTWEKDLHTLAEAYNLLRKTRSDFCMVVAGDGPIRKKLESLMSGAIFLGHVERLKLSQVYASSDILVFPSTTETFGNVTVEAMASGLVPVVANAGGSKSLVKNGENGFLTEPKNPDDICKKVSILLDNPQMQLQMRNVSLEFVKKFKWSSVFDEFLKMYQELLKK